MRAISIQLDAVDFRAEQLREVFPAVRFEGLGDLRTCGETLLPALRGLGVNTKLHLCDAAARGLRNFINAHELLEVFEILGELLGSARLPSSSSTGSGVSQP